MLSNGIFFSYYPAYAGDVHVEPTFGLEQRWTDNALSTSSDRKADFVTTADPGLSLSGEGRQLNFGLDYNAAYDAYASQSRLDGWRQTGLALAKAELVEGLLFLDARGSVSQEALSPTGAVTADNRTASGNRVQVGSTVVTPSLRHAFGGAVLAEVDYRHEQTAYMNAAAGSATSGIPLDSQGDGGKLSLRSGEDFDTTMWSAVSEVDRESRDSLVFTDVANTVGIERKLNSAVWLLAHLGYDRVSDPQIDGSKYSGVFYGGGAHWAPEATTDLRGEIGQRYDGLDLSLRGTTQVGPGLTLRVEHRTGLETEQQSFADALDLVERDDEGRFVNPFSGLAAAPTASPFVDSSSVFRVQRSDLALVYSREDDSVTLTAGQIGRKDASTLATTLANGLVLVPAGDSSAVTLALTASHRLGETLTASAGVSGEDIYGATLPSGKGQVWRAAFDLAYLVNPTTTARFGYRYVDTQPDQAASVHENMVSLGGRKTF